MPSSALLIVVALWAWQDAGPARGAEAGAGTGVEAGAAAAAGAVAAPSPGEPAAVTDPTPPSGAGDGPPAQPHDLLTEAERSGWRGTGRHADVVAMVDALAARSPYARRATLGVSVEGRELPLLVFADPPVATAAEARAQVAEGKLLAFVFANIHAGEVCGKEALLMLARELAEDPEHPDVRPLLDGLVLVLAPLYNADGNERMAPDNRPGQDGPELGMGIRRNAMGLDLNRDYVKLEAPETRAMVAFLREWNPHLVIDCHTTNGSLHRYELTYAAPLNPAGPALPLETVRDLMLPEVSRRLEERTGFRTHPYGNFDAARTRWETYSALPRFGAQYHGLRGHLSILSEAYAKAPWRTRVEATREFVRECLLYAVRHRARLRAVVTSGRAQVRMLGRAGGPADPVGLRYEAAAAPVRAAILGWEERPGPDGEPQSTGRPRIWDVEHFDRFVAVTSVPRPRAYLVPADLGDVLDRLAMHGIVVHRAGDLVAAHGKLDGTGAGAEPPAGLEVEAWRVDAITRAEQPFEGHHLLTLEATLEERSVPFDPEWRVVPLDQELGTLAVLLLEPLSADGFAAWNLLDGHLEPGADYPVLRLTARPDWLPRL